MLLTGYFSVFCVLLAVVNSASIRDPNLQNKAEQCRFGRRERQHDRVKLGKKECCVDNAGEIHHYGDKWLNGHLMYQCEEGGYEITGCQIRPGNILKPGEDLVKDNVAHRCYRSHHGTHTIYSEYNCGLSEFEPSCELEPIDTQPVGFGKFEGD